MKTQITGRLAFSGAEHPELRHTGTGVAVTSFTVFEKAYRDGDPDTSVRVQAWRSLAVLAVGFTKGAFIRVTSFAEPEIYVPDEGQPRLTHTAHMFELWEGPAAAEGGHWVRVGGEG